MTAACIQNDKLGVLFDFNEEWEKAAKASDNANSKMVTGVTVVRSEFLEEHPEAVKTFLDAHKKSADFAINNVEETAKLVAEYGIIEKAPVAQKALPKCNITCITGAEMKEALSSYLAVLHEFSAQSVGGKLPAEDFYYAD